MDFTNFFYNNCANYTLQQLIACYQKLNTRAFDRLNVLFSRTVEYKLERCNAYIEYNGNSAIIYGIGLIVPDTPKSAESDTRIYDTMIKNLDELEANETELTEKKIAVLKCVRTFICAFPFISSDELYTLNVLFVHVLFFNRYISPELKDTKGNLFYSFSWFRSSEKIEDK